jgi:Flp pilus assembly protein TadD
MLHSSLSDRAHGHAVSGASATARRTGWMALAMITPMLTACTGPTLSLLPTELATTTDGAKPAVATNPALAADQMSTTPAANVLTEARGLRRAGDKKKAFDLIDAAIAKAPAPDRTLLVEGGLLALEIGAPEKAEAYLKKAEDPAKPDWRVLSGLGVASSAQGRHEEARRHFKAALALSPGQPAVLNNLALSHVLEKKPGEAEKVLREASKAAPKSARIKQNLALTQGLKGRTDDLGEGASPEKTAAPDKPAAIAPRKAAAAVTPSWETTAATSLPVALPNEKTTVNPPRSKVAQSYMAPETNQLGIGASIGD